MEKELLTVHEVSELSGVSIRTLHYYDEIGLLRPATSTDAGYRLYDDTSLGRLQSIMLFRELEFSLKDIKTIIDRPDFDQVRALEDQIKILELKRDHLDNLIDYANRLKTKGETEMSFEAFDNSKIEQYQKLAKEAWGDTPAYKEYEQKSAKYSENDVKKISEGLMDIFYEFKDMKNMSPSDAKVQAQVKKLKDYITEHYYTCTDQILEGLGIMYVDGGDMQKSIDGAGGKGCAEFVARAINKFCNH